MAQMLVRVVDRNSADPYKHAQLTKRGDVIVIVDDAHVWSSAELAGDQWIVVKVDAEPKDLIEFVQEEPFDAKNPTNILKRRNIGFNLAAYLQSPHLHQGLTLTQAKAFSVQKPPTPDPNVL